MAGLALATSAAAAQPLAATTVDAKIAAFGAWVVWSVGSPGGFRLMGAHDGRVATLPVRPRRLPFDVDLGTDGHGHTVATYSRCSRSGCRVRVLDLATGAERLAGVPHRRGDSDTFPSMWSGRIAFARHRGAVDRVLLWSPRARRVTVLPHGAVPTECPYPTGCRGITVRARVDGLDLGPNVVSFLWSVQGPAVAVRTEIRVDRISTRRSVRVASGHGGEACTANPDAVGLSAPTVAGGAIWFSQLAAACNVYTSALFRYATSPVAGATAALPGIVLQVAKDGPRLFALVATPANPICSVAAPCTIEQIAAPPLAPVGG